MPPEKGRGDWGIVRRFEPDCGRDCSEREEATRTPQIRGYFSGRRIYGFMSTGYIYRHGSTKTRAIPRIFYYRLG